MRSGRSDSIEPAPKSLEKEDRIRETLQPAENYRVVQKAEIGDLGEDPD